MPEIVFWNLSNYNTVEVQADRKGVALMSGFSPAMMKVFMGESEEDVVELAQKDGWEAIQVKDEAVPQEDFSPVSVMQKALYLKSYNDLVVLD